MNRSLFYLLTASVATPALALEPLPVSKEFWKDPAFVSSFNGSYRINARIEPNLSGEERAVLVQVQKKMESGERDAALKLLSDSELTKSSAALLYNIGNIQFELGKNDEAIQSFQAALKLYPSFRRAHRNLALSYVRNNDYERALPSVLEAVALGDQDGTTLGLLGYCYLQKEKYASALQAYRAAQLTQPDMADWKIGAAQCLGELDRLDEAEKLIIEVSEQRPEEVSYQLLLSDIQYRMGKMDASMAGLEWLRRKGQLASESKITLGNMYVMQGDLRQASDLFKEVAAAMEPKLQEPYLNATERVLERNLWELAAEMIDALKNIKIEDKSLSAKSKCMRAILAMRAGEPQAKDLLSEVLASNPNHGEALVLMGDWYKGQKEYEHAALQYERAAKLPDYGKEAWLAHGRMLVEQKRFEAALPLLKKAAEGDQDPYLAKYIKAVENLTAAN